MVAGDVEVVLRVEGHRLDRVRSRERRKVAPVVCIDVNLIKRLVDVDAFAVIDRDAGGQFAALLLP